MITENEEDQLLVAKNELAFQAEEREKRAAELVIANEELLYQNNEKEKRASELVIANKELLYQNNEKEKRAAELVIANEELLYQNNEKEKRAAELVIANEELLYQNKEKGKRAAELVIANKKLAFQMEEKEKRERELLMVNEELLAFNFISSHDLKEPLRKIQTFVSVILEDTQQTLSAKGAYRFQRIQAAAARMQEMIEDLVSYSRICGTERILERTNISLIIEEVQIKLDDSIRQKEATFELQIPEPLKIIPTQFKELLYHLIDNALKFSSPHRKPYILIQNKIIKGNEVSHAYFSSDQFYYHLLIQDNGIGFDTQYSERIFEVFQTLHDKGLYTGTGIGLAIVKKIVQNHHGLIVASSQEAKGATFDIYLPIHY